MFSVTTHTSLRPSLKIAALAVLWGIVSMSWAADNAVGITISTGAHYTSGTYGSAVETEIIYLPVSAKLQYGRLSTGLTIAYLQVTGPGNVIPEIGDIGNGLSPVRTRFAGQGDTVGYVGYYVCADEKRKLWINALTQVKLATADEKHNLGTGKNDYSLQFDFYKEFDQAGMFATVGYTKYGDPPGRNFRATPYVSGGALYKVDYLSTVGASINWRRPIVEGVAPHRQVTVFLSRKLARSIELQTYVGLGLSDATPDVGMGLGLTYTLSP
jgi:hypothetical protein